MNYLERAVGLSQQSYDAGEFPAGAVLVSRSGKVYDSEPSLVYNHGEMMVIDKAIAAEGCPLGGAVIYASMEPCLMCSAKMYWAGVERVEFVIPKRRVEAMFAYEDPGSVSEHTKGFFQPIQRIENQSFAREALKIYRKWQDPKAGPQA